jgi:DNA-directed RNA polymerase subunit N (RpoN/RPB10)
MLDHVVCLNCGYPIGDVAPLFREARRRRARAELERQDVDAAQADTAMALDVDVEDLFELLGIPAAQLCCRMHLATAMRFSDYY